jgi:hypothetical protein
LAAIHDYHRGPVSSSLCVRYCLNLGKHHQRLTDTLARIADHKITRIDDLLPWRYAATAA